MANNENPYGEYEWHFHFRNLTVELYLGCFSAVTLLTRGRFQYVSPEVFSLLVSVGLYLRFCRMCLEFMMTDYFSQEQLLYCVPGSNASCVMEQFSFWTNVALYLVFVSVMLVTILGNSVVIVSICHFKQLHSPTNVFILSLALVDLLVGVIVIPICTVTTIYGCWFYGNTYCQIHTSLDVFFTTLSILHLICIAVDRHEAICNPLHYSRKITMSVAVMMVCVSWALAAVYSFGLFFSKNTVAGLKDLMASTDCLGICNIYLSPLWGILDSALCFFFPCTVMVCLYTQIFIVAKQHVRKIGDMSTSLNDRGRGGLIRAECKAAKTLSIVLGVFIFCWMPFFMNSIIDPLTGFRIPGLLFEVLYWLGFFNSACNPIIYALFYPSFKKCFHYIITLKIFSSNSSTVNLSVK